MIAVIAAGALGAQYFADSCEFDIPYVTREALESSQAETKEVRAALESVQESYARQNRELSSILSRLAELSCQTTSLQIGTEGGSAQLTQAEKIEGGLNALEGRIDKLEKEAARARKLDKDLAVSAQTIKNLRKTIESQQQEIRTLRQTVADREATIRTQESVIAVQKDTISQQYETIVRQKEELKKTVAGQTEMIFQAGYAFEQLGDDGDRALNVSGRKDKNMVKEYKKAIYSKAEQFYQQAARENHAGAAGRSEVVKYKIASL